VMIIAMVIPALGPQLFQEALDHSLPQKKVADVLTLSLQRFDVRRMTSS
jgi:hypothetical protein